MGTNTAKGTQGRLHFAREALAILISIVSFIISTVNVYMTNLKSPDLNIVVAPFMRQIVDNTSLNEAFFIPVTVVNQGAKPGSILSFDLTVTFVPSGAQETYYAQYLASSDNPETLGSFFAPMNLTGYSADGHTLCFYPLGERDGNFFAQPGEYEFLLTAMAANVKGQSPKRITQEFQVVLTQEMFEQMQNEPDFEYRYPLPVETNGATRPLIEIISNIFR